LPPMMKQEIAQYRISARKAVAAVRRYVRQQSSGNAR